MPSRQLIPIAKHVKDFARELLLAGQEFDRRRSSAVLGATSGALRISVVSVATSYLPALSFAELVVPTAIVFMGFGTLLARFLHRRDSRHVSYEDRIRQLSLAHEILVEHLNALPRQTSKKTRENLETDVDRINNAITNLALSEAGRENVISLG